MSHPLMMQFTIKMKIDREEWLAQMNGI